ncbi:glycosyltransferase family 2 protein [Mycobacterium spongiae]|uniref:Glycosyltransferase n=1 Tax=Mycobacterium spongiae TaxID=886343 RepID=A0A975JX64_9MYCO|nr:glycosyltransferase [Mycobacterium spongiae]QUR67329.1 glycosyltransferase [Mycobacterium spongiae]
MRANGVDNAPAHPTISVCVPMYNNAATIARCLRGILDQEGADFEVVVVDDGSSDDSVKIASRMLRPEDRLISNESRLGLNQNHNRCLELARGGLIQFVHGDDWLLPGALRTLAPCFDDPAVGMAFAPRRVVQDDNLPRRRRVGPAHKHFWRLRDRNRGPWLVAQMALRGGAGNWIGEPTCVMFRRRLAVEAGAFRTDIYQLVDLDFWYRLMLRSVVCFVPQELSVRTHAVSTESMRIVKSGQNWLDQLRILTWLIVDPMSPRAVRVIATVGWSLTWLVAPVRVVAFGPQRTTRLKTLARAPVSEFAFARRWRDNVLSHSKAVS